MTVPMSRGRLIPRQERHLYEHWETIPRFLKAEEGQWVYIGSNGRQFDLYGRNAGRQGVRLLRDLSGVWDLPFEHLLTESAYQVGATYERSNINKRIINLGVGLGGPKYTAEAYRMIENNWWDAWPHDQPGWLGRHTRFGGWRWLQVMQAKPVDTTIKMDGVAYGNNFMAWDMQILAPKPWYSKRMLVENWTANAQTVAANGFDEETISIANRGQLPVSPFFIYTGPGRAWVQDGMTTRMVELPLLSAADGYVLVDTNEDARTLTASTDPVDNLFYDLVRQSRVLDFFLHDIATLGLPVWRRAPGIRFTSQIPPRTVANLKVRHDTAGGTVTVLMPQRFKRPS